MNLEEALFYSKLIIKNGDYYSGQKFREYSKGYFGTTEDINYYLTKEKFNKNRALTVLASGDQVFNLILKGVKEIDAFDINKLQYYVYYLKKAMVEVLSYEEFLDAHMLFFSVYLAKIREILEKVKSNLKEDVYEYYRILLDYGEKKGRLENLYYFVIRNRFIKNNSYLLSEESYLTLRERLNMTKVNLYFEDVKTVPKIVDGNYDLILLSNISDYLKIANLNDFIASFYKLLNNNGLIINYLYNNNPYALNDLGVNNVVKINDQDGYLKIRKK